MMFNGLIENEKRVAPDKYTHCKLKALKPLRIQMGMNFIDQFTPLVILDFCINQTASLLMI